MRINFADSFGPHFVENLGASTAGVGCTVVLLAASYTLGRYALAILRARSGAVTDRVAATLTGYMGWGFLVLALASLGLARHMLLGAAMGLITLIGLHQVTISIRWGPPRHAWSWTAVVAVTLGVAGLLPVLLLPETLGDCMSYHLALPAEILKTGRLPATPVAPTWMYPLAADFVNTIPMALGLDQSVRGTGLALAILGAIALTSVLVPGLPFSAMALMSLGVLSLQREVSLMTLAKNDTTVAGIVLTMLGVALESGRPRGGRVLLVSFLGGAALAAKYVVAPVVFATLVLSTWSRMDGRSALACVIPSLALLTPWLVRSWVQTSDPVYPYGTRLELPHLGARTYQAETAQSLRLVMMSITPETLAYRLWHAAGDLAFFWLTFPLAWLHGGAPVRRGVVVASAALIISLVVYPGGGGHVFRFLQPVYLALSIVGVGGLLLATRRIDFSRNSLTEGWLNGALCAAVVGIVWWRPAMNSQVTHWADPQLGRLRAAYHRGELRKEEYRRAMLGSYGEVVTFQAGQGCPSGPNKALIVGTVAHWGINGPVLADGYEPAHVWRIVRESAHAARVGIKFRQLGIRHILYEADFASWDRSIRAPFGWTPRMLRLYHDWAVRHLRVLTSAPCLGPGYGYTWWLEVLRGEAGQRTIHVLPGVDSALADVLLAAKRGNRGGAMFAAEQIHRMLPDVAAVTAFCGQAFTRIGNYRMGYDLTCQASDAGWRGCMDPCLLDRVGCALELGRIDEAAQFLEEARRAFPLWKSSPVPELAAAIAERRRE